MFDQCKAEREPKFTKSVGPHRDDQGTIDPKFRRTRAVRHDPPGLVQCNHETHKFNPRGKNYEHKTIITHEKDLDVESSIVKKMLSQKKAATLDSKKELDHFALF